MNSGHFFLTLWLFEITRNRSNLLLSNLVTSLHILLTSFHLQEDTLNRIRIDRLYWHHISIANYKRKKEIRREQAQSYSSSGTNSSLDTHRQPGDRKTIYQSLDNWSLSLVPAEVELLSVLRWSAPPGRE